MDIADLTPKVNTCITKLEHPVSGEPLKHNKTQMYIERYLPHTKEYKRVRYELTQKYIELSEEVGQRKIDLMQAEEDSIELMARTTVSWKLYYDGTWVDFDVDKAKEIYDKAPWIVEQLDKKERNTDLFT